MATGPNQVNNCIFNCCMTLGYYLIHVTYYVIIVIPCNNLLSACFIVLKKTTLKCKFNIFY